MAENATPFEIHQVVTLALTVAGFAYLWRSAAITFRLAKEHGRPPFRTGMIFEALGDYLMLLWLLGGILMFFLAAALLAWLSPSEYWAADIASAFVSTGALLLLLGGGTRILFKKLAEIRAGDGRATTETVAQTGAVAPAASPAAAVPAPGKPAVDLAKHQVTIPEVTVDVHPVVAAAIVAEQEKETSGETPRVTPRGMGERDRV